MGVEIGGGGGRAGDAEDLGFTFLDKPYDTNDSQIDEMLRYLYEAVKHTSTPVVTRSLGVVVDGGGSAITSGGLGYLYMPYSGVLTGWVLLADQVGSIAIDIWKLPYVNYAPTVANSITASAKPSLVSAKKNLSNVLPGWKKTITAGDVLAFSVTSATTVTWASLLLKFTQD